MITREELLNRLQDEEDNFVERKLEGANNADLRETMVAFANTVQDGQSAILFIGVANDGTLVGIGNPDSLQKTVRKLAEQVCYPTLAYSCEVIKKAGKRILAVIIAPSKHRPHFSGPAFVRKGSENVLASPELYEQLIASRHEKVGPILRNKGSVITMMEKRRQDPMYYKKHEARIEACDAHVVHLHQISDNRNVAHSLERVMISYDPERNRMMLEVFE